MKNTAKVIASVVNTPQAVVTPPVGIMFVIGPTVRGITDNPEDLITSIAQFERLYGGLDTNNNFPLNCEQALLAGAILRVCKVTGAGAAVATSTLATDVAAVDCFGFTSKGEGTYYNDFTAEVKAATNGLADYFNLVITDVTGSIVETYENLIITGFGTAGPYTYLKDVVEGSALVDVVYQDITAAAVQNRPVNAVETFSGGLQGVAPVLADYVGSQPDKTGFYAFDSFDDAFIVAAPSENETLIAGLMNAGKAYATLRKDLIYLQHLDNDNATHTEIIAELDGFAVSKYAGAIGGGLKVSDLVLGGVKSMQGLGEGLGVIAKSHNANGVWVSPTNFANGVYADALGVVNNFGSPASVANRELIANAGGNMIVNKSNQTMLWDFYSLAAADTAEKFLTIVLLEMFIIKSLKPLLESFLGKPNTFTNFRAIYFSAKPFLDSLVDQDALFEYKWDGDQNANSLDELQINTPEELAEGDYKIQLQIKAVVPMVEISIDIILTPAGVDFV